MAESPLLDINVYLCPHPDCGPFTKQIRPNFFYDEKTKKHYCSEGCYELAPKKKKLQTEDTGKIFEMAICMLFDTPYTAGEYKYSIEKAQAIKARMSKLKELFPPCLHTAENGSRYDFTALNESNNYLSAKSIKKDDGKIAPQVIGQAKPKKFCEVLGISYTTNEDLKKYIQNNITDIFPYLMEYTFSCPMVLYHEERQTIRYIKLTTPIDWKAYTYTWTNDFTVRQSASVKIIVKEKKISLMEFQFHTKSRTNMANRWYIEDLINVFAEHFTIINI